ncbi:hypothetical protein KPH14_013092, partial [Odynerus spinipes]
WASRCPFVLDRPCGNVPLGVDPSTVSPCKPPARDTCGCGGYHGTIGGLSSVIRDLNLDDLKSMEIRPISKPVYPDFVSYDVRLSSFDVWPKSISQSKERLAHAGFFYTGKSDQTLCHHCGAGLKDWEVDDDPWVEHAKWKPDCFYL